MLDIWKLNGRGFLGHIEGKLGHYTLTVADIKCLDPTIPIDEQYINDEVCVVKNYDECV